MEPADILTGSEAIMYACEHGLTLNKYGDPLGGPRTGLTVEQASIIAGEDPGLIWIRAGGR